ncbi:hypothetical protein [Pseudoxanthomonas dokdonensis]|uniref:Transmembrane protein n=1 Tax=Pseudoxanthomonas dokdonensis TaxID=344882 RepID=A0A0R0CKR8_9GAMM|nr:hypothetical protein [Pseudoxanthomonas dokdonensis]KRG70621.1 hypothetical protein ABB29_06070 [Pseudoxanthomonas dokdonensis]
MNKHNVINFLITLRCIGDAAVILGMVLAITTLVLASTNVFGGFNSAIPMLAGRLLAVTLIPGALLAILSRLSQFFVRRARFEHAPATT